jgi:cardiolipin synthase
MDQSFALSMQPVFACNRVQLIRGGKEYFELLKQLIQSATSSIHLQTYIFEDDETGVEIGEALMNAVKRGVKVYLMVDAYASRKLSNSFIEKLQQSGVLFKEFEPLLKNRNFYFGRRLHHKVFVADSIYSLVGGINISNRYNDMQEQIAWLDWAVYVEGAVSAELEQVCKEVWDSPFLIRKIKLKHIVPTFISKDNPYLIRVRRNDWVYRKNQISRTYIDMFRKASTSIIILSSYFLPGRIFRKHLERALKRGVRITVITAGNSDVMLAKKAERYLYRWLLKRGVDIYEYQPSVLHGKLSICDNELVTVGSYNVNNISAYASIELNLDIYSKLFAGQTMNKLKQIIEHDCIKVTAESYETNYGRFQRLLQWSSYLIFRFIFFLFTFYFKQKE